MTRVLVLSLVLAACAPPAPPKTAADGTPVQEPPSTAVSVADVGLGLVDIACAVAPTPDLCHAAVRAMARLLHPSP